MFCNKCGTENPENSSYCSKCGTTLAISNIAVPSVVTAAPLQKPKSGWAITAFIIGIPGLLSIPFSIVAIILGIIGINKTSQSANRSGRGFAVTGLVLGILGIAVFLLVSAFALGKLSGPLLNFPS